MIICEMLYSYFDALTKTKCKCNQPSFLLFDEIIDQPLKIVNHKDSITNVVTT